MRVRAVKKMNCIFTVPLVVRGVNGQSAWSTLAAQNPGKSRFLKIFFSVPTFCLNTLHNRVLFATVSGGSGQLTGGAPGLQIRCGGLNTSRVGSIPMHFRHQQNREEYDL